MEGLLDFLQKYSDVDIDFIKQFIEIRKGDNLHAPFTIDLDLVTDWLKSSKWKLKKTLLKTYTQNIDYITLNPEVEREKDENRENRKRGGQNKETILLTSDTFKMMCMKSMTKNAQKIRYYYVTLEKLVEIYKDDIIKNQNSKIEILERNLKKIKYPVKGAVYILQLTPEDNQGFKVGKTEDMNKRLQVYNTSMKDSPNVVYIFYSYDVDRLEKCLKTALKYYEYKKDKEYYKVTKDVIIDAINDCQYLISKYTCKDCNKDMEIKKISRHNEKHHESKDKMVITTLVEYENDDNQEQFGGLVINNYEYFIAYKLNKTHYYDLTKFSDYY
jgi:hypothetical protein